MTLLSNTYEDTTFYYPAFKSLARVHADAMLNQGNIYIPTLQGFTDAKRYSGSILDITEGTLNVENHYTFYAGLAKQANGLIPLLHRPYDSVTANELNIQQTITIRPCHVYCMTQYFLSDSFEWAVKEAGKETCVLIKDLEAFLNLVNPELALHGLRLAGIHDCLYHADETRTIREVDPSEHSLTNFILRNESMAPFVKPTRFREQRELRALWVPKDPNIGNVSVFVPAIRNLLMRVEFSRVDVDLYFSPAGDSLPLGCEVHYNNGQPFEYFTIKEPRQVFSPIIWTTKGEPLQFGFWNRDGHVFANMDFAGMPITPGFLVLYDKQILCPRPLATIDHLEFYFPAKDMR
jgi:hypothetical protein